MALTVFVVVNARKGERHGGGAARVRQVECAGGPIVTDHGVGAFVIRDEITGSFVRTLSRLVEGTSRRKMDRARPDGVAANRKQKNAHQR